MTYILRNALSLNSFSKLPSSFSKRTFCSTTSMEYSAIKRTIDGEQKSKVSNDINTLHSEFFTTSTSSPKTSSSTSTPITDNEYKTISRQQLGTLRNRPFEPQRWTNWFRKYTTPPIDSQSIYSMRILIIRQTLNVFATSPWQYESSDGHSVTLNEEKLREQLKYCKKYPDLFISNNKSKEYSEQAAFGLYRGDCVEMARWLKRCKGLNPAILNMASATSPGGGFRLGLGAQEENLHRRSNLYQHTEAPGSFSDYRNWQYPIPTFGGLYSKNVLFFRGIEAKGYPFLSDPETFGVISVAADNRPTCSSPERLNAEYTKRAKQKIRAIFEIARDQEHDSVVLSAFGCGAFMNPPSHIAELFHDVIEENQYRHKFAYIGFAIIDDHNARKPHNPKGNIQPFVDQFGKDCIVDDSLHSADVDVDRSIDATIDTSIDRSAKRSKQSDD